MTKKLLSANAAHQRQRILEWLQQKSLTTYEARQELDVFHPSARVQKLKEQGYNIQTHWTTVKTLLGSHRVAHYVLLSGSENVV